LDTGLISSVTNLTPIYLSLLLAATTTLVLIVTGTPLAWWLANTQSRARPIIESITALPLVLPPTVIGFYFLIILGPAAPIGKFWLDMTGTTLTFSFSGLVVASVFYSLPFMVQPLQTAFEAVGRKPVEAAASLGARPFDAFFSIVAPMARRGFVTAAVLTFAHTIGEFGVVLMVGGNIPGETRVLSISIYEHVETLNYADAHLLSAGLLVFSFAVLMFVYSYSRGIRVNGR
jgi:molybdate transport system permease protein